MKHKWKFLTPNSGPLVTTVNPRTSFRYRVDWRLFCTECKECLDIPYDVLDTDKIVDFSQKQKKRDDCSGKKCIKL